MSCRGLVHFTHRLPYIFQNSANVTKSENEGVWSWGVHGTASRRVAQPGWRSSGGASECARDGARRKSVVNAPDSCPNLSLQSTSTHVWADHRAIKSPDMRGFLVAWWCVTSCHPCHPYHPYPAAWQDPQPDCPQPHPSPWSLW